MFAKPSSEDARKAWVQGRESALAGEPREASETAWSSSHPTPTLPLRLMWRQGFFRGQQERQQELYGDLSV